MPRAEAKLTLWKIELCAMGGAAPSVFIVAAEDENDARDALRDMLSVEPTDWWRGPTAITRLERGMVMQCRPDKIAGAITFEVRGQ